LDGPKVEKHVTGVVYDDLLGRKRLATQPYALLFTMRVLLAPLRELEQTIPARDIVPKHCT
jgi:hypothetical protein